MPKLETKKNHIIKMSAKQILSEANSYILANPRFILCIAVVNMVFMLLFKSIPDGISNPLSILWAIVYYIFWCFFYRYYYGLRPYFQSGSVYRSLAPSSKAMALMLVVVMVMAVLPVLPIFLGFNEKYLDFYEGYMSAIEGLSNGGEVSISLGNMLVCFGFLSLLAPFLLCKPYLAWISSLRGRSASFRNVGDRTKGNYWTFVLISAILLYPEALAMQFDRMWNLQNWLDYSVGTIIFIYTNIVFAKIYDWFYLKN